MSDINRVQVGYKSNTTQVGIIYKSDTSQCCVRYKSVSDLIDSCWMGKGNCSTEYNVLTSKKKESIIPSKIIQTQQKAKNLE